MTLPPSRAMSQLVMAIAAERDELRQACLRAERAGLQARCGHLDEARAELAQLEARRHATPALGAWICIAEGLIDHFSHLGPAARDRMMRAHALSSAARMRPLIALSAAWLAHMDYVQHDVVAMARHVAEALQEAAADHHAARARACIVVAQGYHFGGRLDLAQPWYARTRTHATAMGDQATLSALMHNRAWLSGHQARMASLFEPGAVTGDTDRVRQALLSAESTGYFDQHADTASLGSLVPVLRAQLLTVQGRHEQALTLYDVHLTTAMQQGLERMKAVCLGDIAWCKLHLNRPAEALIDAQAAHASIDPSCDVDDRADAHGRLAQVYAALGHDDIARQHAADAAAALQVHTAQQARIVKLLDEALAKVPGL
jgi:tetratricopeptide (TPR) repeat protein